MTNIPQACSSFGKKAYLHVNLLLVKLLFFFNFKAIALYLVADPAFMQAYQCMPLWRQVLKISFLKSTAVEIKPTVAGKLYFLVFQSINVQEYFLVGKSEMSDNICGENIYTSKTLLCLSKLPFHFSYCLENNGMKVSDQQSTKREICLTQYYSCQLQGKHRTPRND